MADSVSFGAGVSSGIDGMFDLLSFTAGVAPGIDDNAAPVVLRVGNKGSSGSFGKLSVYNTLALLLFSTPSSFQQSCASISVPPNNMTSS